MIRTTGEKGVAVVNARGNQSMSQNFCLSGRIKRLYFCSVIKHEKMELVTNQIRGANETLSKIKARVCSAG